MRRIISAFTLALTTAGLYAAQPAQQSADDATITGCLQRAPSGVEKVGRFVLMNASNSPLGATANDEVQAPEPSRRPEPTERHPQESGDRISTGGVTYVLQGNAADLGTRVGQRVEVVGTIGSEVAVNATRLTTAKPMRIVQVKQVRAIKASC